MTNMRVQLNHSLRIIARRACCCFLFSLIILAAGAQHSANNTPGGKKISRDLFGLFFEDINYAADGGLYAELVQNRSFEYSPADRREWNPFSFWQYITPGYSYGAIGIETASPVHPNNPHYIVLNVEHVGDTGVGIRNNGFERIPMQGGENYNFSLFARQLGKDPVSLWISLRSPQGRILAENRFTVGGPAWKKYTATLSPATGNDSASLFLLATSEGRLAMDVISLFPEKTFRNRPNGMRADLAQLLADMKPAFIRFPGGCLAHGDGLGNMYRWKNTIGPIEERVEQKNIWGYHQTGGLGYFEYFQFCEDIGAKPLPVLPAAVSCQNSGGTWRIGGTGQKAIPMEEMQDYIQEVLDLVEWANGPASSAWGAKRAAAGHPEPFHLQYIGVGNEDRITPAFEQRFKMIYDAVRAKYPDITVVGTVGPFPDGEDFEKGWKLADQWNIPVVDEHYYSAPEWFLSHQYRYDGYKRNATRVYVGEYASKGNRMKNALAEAVYMTALERNADVVSMASYAPLLAKRGFTQWNPDMIYFDNTRIYPTVNYYVQKMFSANQGDFYFTKVIRSNPRDSMVASSCVQDSRTGDIILKLVNAGNEKKLLKVDLRGFRNFSPEAVRTEFAGSPEAVNAFGEPASVLPVTSPFRVSRVFDYTAPPSSVTVIRIRTRS